MNTYRFDVARHAVLRAMGIAPLAAATLAGCAVEGEPVALDDTTFQTQLDAAPFSTEQAPPPGVLVLDAATPVVAGQLQTATVSGAAPFSTLLLVAGRDAAAGPCPAALNGTCMDVTSPVVIGRGTADASGIAVLDYAVPHEVPEGTTVHLQAASPLAGPGDTSQVVSDLATYPTRACGDHPWLDGPISSTGFDVFLACAPLPSSGVCPTHTQLPYARGLALFERLTGQASVRTGGAWDAWLSCDETTVQDACCFEMNVGQVVIGRPFTIGGEARVATECADTGWATPMALQTQGLNRRTRRRLAAAWQRTALGEHASVASFARFVLQLVQVGAPADLVSEATRAMSDEIRHAQTAFGIASAFAGTPMGVGGLDTQGAMEHAELLDIVLDTVREGCIAETLAASQAGVAWEACTEPTIRAALAKVMEDEARHAQLAWRFVEWAITQHPELRQPVQEAFCQALQHPPVAADPLADVLRAHGVLCEAEMQAVANRAHAEIVLPCAQALLQQHVGLGLAA